MYAVRIDFKFQFIVLLENAVGNAVLSVPKEFWGSMPQNSYDFHNLQYKYMPLRGRNAEDSVPYGMPDKLQFTTFDRLNVIYGRSRGNWRNFRRRLRRPGNRCI